MNNNGLILKSGYKYILVVFLASVFAGLFICDTFAFILFMITLFTVYVFRVSNRHTFSNSEHIISPVDGEVMAIDHIDGKQNIYCKVGLCDTHVVKAPVDGHMKIKEYRHGLNLNPNSYKGSMLNEQLILKFHKLKLKLLSGHCNPTIEYSKETEVKQGDDIAIFVDGIAIITLKEKRKLDISIGDKLIAAQTIICH